MDVEGEREQEQEREGEQQGEEGEEEGEQHGTRQDRWRMAIAVWEKHPKHRGSDYDPSRK